MQRSLHDVWGCARGPVTALAPPTRLATGAAVFAACMVPSVTTLPGSLAVVGVVAVWLATCRVPFRVLRLAVLLGLALFVPYFLLLPLLPDAPPVFSGSWQRALAVPWTILLRGMSGMLVSVATVTTLSASDLREALVRLPVPGIVSAILLQIIHQTSTLFYETRRVAAAMAVRGASSGVATGWRVLASLPRVWLPRIAVRAERVADAMELRGFCDEELRPLHQMQVSPVDIAALSAAVVVLAGAVALRVTVAA